MLNKFREFIGDTRGFLETYILTVYLVIFITMLAFIMGLGFGTLKQAHAKHGYFAEAMTFCASAAGQMNPAGDINRELALQYFEAAMEEMEVGDYTLKSFSEVEPGDYVSKAEGVAQYPGYYAKVDMPVAVVNVPLLGQQNVVIPMGYYAVSTTKEGGEWR